MATSKGKIMQDKTPATPSNIKSLSEQYKEMCQDDMKRMAQIRDPYTLGTIIGNGSHNKLPTQSGMSNSSIGTNVTSGSPKLQGTIKSYTNSQNGISWSDSGTYLSESELTQVKKDLAAIKKRLMILEPNLQKMEKFQALKDAYEHYLCMEKLCDEDMPGAQGGT
jgi:hypothetical protein